MLVYVAWNTPMALAIYENVEKHIPGETFYLTNIPIVREFCVSKNLDYIFIEDRKEAGEWVRKTKPDICVSHCFLNDIVNTGIKVQMFHGLIEKNWTYSHKNLIAWDYFIVPGDYGKERLMKNLKIDENKILTFGYPKLDIWKPSGKDYPRNKPNILYCPTHSGLSSEKIMLEPLLDLNKTYSNIRVKLHDATKYRQIYEEHFEVSNNYNIIYDFNWADIVISDCSSAIIEANLCKLPIIQIDMKSHDWLKATNQLEMVYRDKLGYRLKYNELYRLKDYVEFASLYGFNRDLGLLGKIVKYAPSGHIVANFLSELHQRATDLDYMV